MVAYTHIVNGKVIPFTDEEKAEWDIKMAKLAQPLRVAVTGKNISPSIDDTLRLLGKKNTLKRLNSAIDYIENLSPS